MLGKAEGGMKDQNLEESSDLHREVKLPLQIKFFRERPSIWRVILAARRQLGVVVRFADQEKRFIRLFLPKVSVSLFYFG
jgi:hypothetical protein